MQAVVKEKQTVEDSCVLVNYKICSMCWPLWLGHECTRNILLTVRHSISV
jgi:hypothetical protein